MTDVMAARAGRAARSRAWARLGGGRLRYVLLVATLAAAYYGAAQLGYALEFAGPVAAIVWLPVGVGIAFLYLGGLRLLAGRADRRPARERLRARSRSARALGQTCGNMLEVLVGDAAACAGSSRAAAARQRRRPRADARRDRRRRGGQRDGRRALAAGSAA